LVATRAAALFALIAFAGSQECQAQSSVKLSWQLADSRITLHEPVLLKLTVENTGVVAATLDLGWNSRQGLLVTVIRPDGTIAKAAAFDPGDETGTITRISIGPGTADTEEFVVDQWYVFDKPGQYRIGASLRFPFKFGDVPLAPGEMFHAAPLFDAPDDPRTRVTPATFQTITIEARDEATLRQRAESLVARALKPALERTPGAQDMDREVAMRALDSIRDPAVIPCLMRLVTPSFVLGTNALGSLARFLNGPLSNPAGLQAFIAVASGQEARGELLFKSPADVGPGTAEANLRRAALTRSK